MTQPGLVDKVQLAAHQIDGVHDVVVLRREEGLPVGSVVGGHQGARVHVGADIPAAGGGGLRLGHTHGGVKGVELAVYVAEAQGVLVDEGQMADAGAAQGLCGVAAHAPQAEHRHMAAAKQLHGVVAQQHGGANQFLLHGVILLFAIHRKKGPANAGPITTVSDMPLTRPRT